MRTPLNLLVTERALAVVSGSGSGHFHDMVIEGAESPEIKNVCAKLSVKLADELDNICTVLDVSKRRFIEAALLEAVHRAKRIMDQEGLWESLEGHNGWHKAEEEA